MPQTICLSKPKSLEFSKKALSGCLWYVRTRDVFDIMQRGLNIVSKQLFSPLCIMLSKMIHRLDTYISYSKWALVNQF